jgi:hypothetical protein
MFYKIYHLGVEFFSLQSHIHSFIHLLYSLRNSLLPGGLVLCHHQLQTVYINRLFYSVVGTAPTSIH